MFAFIMVLGSESVMAQSTPNIIEINAAANKKTEALRKYIKFDNDQRDQMYKALKTYGTRKAKLNQAEPNERSIMKLENELNDTVRRFLNEEQYERYKSFEETN